MENESKRKKSEEALAEIYRNTNLAMQSIEDILPEVDHEGMTKELHAQHEGYSKICAKVAKIAKDKGIALKEPGMFKKAMMWSSIKMSTLSDDSPSHIAEMMVQGTVMGITALKRTAGEVLFDENEDVGALLSDMIKTEEEFEKKWKEYL